MAEENEALDEPEIESPETAGLQEAETPEPEVASIGFGEEPKEEETQPRARSLPGQLRDLYKIEKKRADEEYRKRVELEAKLKGSAVSELGPEPTLKDEDVDFDEIKFRTKTITWNDRKRDIEAQQKKAREANDAVEADYQTKRERYEQRKAAMPFEDFDVAEATVMKMFTETQRALLIKGARQPAELVYALGLHPEKAKVLAGFSDPVDFVSNIAWLEAKELKVERRESTPLPEKKIVGTAPVVTVTGDKKLQALEKEADETNDRTKVIAYRRQLKEKERLAVR